mgnify:CR=1 FL=1|jgi:hypothetical protein
MIFKEGAIKNCSAEHRKRFKVLANLGYQT